jgi:hypothetical protein
MYLVNITCIGCLYVRFLLHGYYEIYDYIRLLHSALHRHELPGYGPRAHLHLHIQKLI